MTALLGASLLWAFSFGLIKGELAGLSPVAVAAGRLLLAAAIFLPLAGRAVGSARARLAAAALGAVQFGLMYVLYVASFRWLAAWVVAVMTIFTPFYVILFTDGLRGRSRSRGLTAAALAVVGAALVSVQGRPLSAGWPGILLLQGANLCFAVGQVRFGALQRRWNAPEAGLLAWMYAGAAAVTAAALPIAAALGDHPLAGWTPRAFLVLLYLGALPTALGFYLWNRGAARTQPAFLAAANNLKIPLAVIVSWLVFGESADAARALPGLLLLVIALVVAGNPAVPGRR